MKRYESIKNLEKEAFEWLNHFILTSITKKPDEDIILFLKKYKTKVDKIYRGIGLISQRFNKNKIKDINELNIGDILPSYLDRQTGISSYSKKLSIAKIYSEGKQSIIVEAIPSKNNIVLDLEFFAKQLKKENNTYFDKEDLNYMIKDKEVIILEPIRAKIISKIGKL